MVKAVAFRTLTGTPGAISGINNLSNDWEEAKEELFSRLSRRLAQYLGATEQEVKMTFPVSENHLVFF